MRHVILHHHIFKNAGSTLDSALQRRFEDGFASIHDSSGDGVVEGDALVDFLEGLPSAQAVSSHHFHGQAFVARGYRFFNVALVRKPLARLVSIYKFSRRSEGALAQLARESDVRTFMKELIAHHPHLVENAQVNIFANHGFYGRPTRDDDLARACARFADFSICAPVERYDEAMVAFEYFNAPVYGARGLDLAYVAQNVSARLPGDGDLRALLGSACHDWLEGVNQRDEALWAFADEELDRRIEAVPAFAHRLTAFRKRCARLGLNAATHGRSGPVAVDAGIRKRAYS